MNNNSMDSLSQNPPSDSFSRTQSNVLKMLVVFVMLFAFFVIIGFVSYFLGEKHEETLKNKQNYHQVSPSPTTSRNDQKFITYEYLAFHLGFPVLDIQIPNDWTAYSIYGKTGVDPTTIVLAHEQTKINGKLNDLIPTITIRMIRNQSLAKVDPLKWSGENQLSLFGAEPLLENWKTIEIKGVSIKIITVPTIGDPITVAYFTKGDAVFTITNNDATQSEFEHALSSFKILNTNHIP